MITSQETAESNKLMMMAMPRENMLTFLLSRKMMKWLRLLIQEIAILILIWETRTMKMIINNLMNLKVKRRRLTMLPTNQRNCLSLRLTMLHQLTINKNCWTREVHRMILKTWSTPLPSHILRSGKL